MKIRIKFKKHGPVRFIGHLDVMRYFQKAIRRADIDIAYTTGYSPHQIMSFAAPLGVGLESNGEYMDIECVHVTTSSDMMNRLNKVGVWGIEVTQVRLLPKEAGNAMASVAAASYSIRFKEGRVPDLRYEEAVNGFLSQDQIYISKETKSGRKEINIKPGIYQMKVINTDKNTSPVIYLMVDASSAGNIKPAKVMEVFFDYLGISLEENALFITREETYTNIGSDVMPKMVPLGDIGCDIL